MSRYLLLSTVLLSSSIAFAVPTEFQHQGRLFDGLGQPLNSPDDLTFRLYDAPSGGTALWTEQHPSVAFVDGYFHVELGSVTALDPAVFDGDPLYVAIQIGVGQELPGRLRLASVPYAFRAHTADGLQDGLVIDAAEIRVNGSTVIDSSGQIDASLVQGSSDTLLDLGCGSGEVAQHDGSGWSCVAWAHTHAADAIVSGTLVVDRLPIGTGAGEVAAGDHGHTPQDVGALPAGTTAADIGALPDTTTAADIGGLPSTATAADIGALPDTTTAADIGAVPAGGDGNINGDLTVSGTVAVGDSSSGTCNAAAEGQIRWNGTSFQGCTGSTWVRLGGSNPGDSSSNPATSCKNVKDFDPALPNGLYWLDVSTNGPFLAYCDMTTLGGGWTLVLHSTYTGSMPPTSDLQVNRSTLETQGAGSANGYGGINTGGFYLMPMFDFKALADQSQDLRFESDNFAQHSVLQGFSMNANYGLDGTNESTIRTELCNGQPNCFIDANGLSTIDYDGDNYGPACIVSYSNTAWWYDNCFHYNAFYTADRGHFSGFSDIDAGTDHWSWWVR